VLLYVAAFDKLGVDGVYKVMKAERLSRKKSLTEGVALSLAEYAAKLTDLQECTLGVSSCHWYEIYSRMDKPRRFAFQPMSFMMNDEFLLLMLMDEFHPWR